MQRDDISSNEPGTISKVIGGDMVTVIVDY